MISVLLADDQALVRAGFRLIVELEPGMDVVGEAEDGRQAVELARELHPDVVLMDIRMPGLDGIEATRRLAAAGSNARVLVLTTFDLDEYVYEAMKAGASGFLLKDVPREQLVAGIRVVADGESLLAPAITRRMIEQFLRRPPPGAAVPPLLKELSDRELEVLCQLACGMSNAEIAKVLYIGDATVKTHVAHILQKLDLRDRVQAVVFAYEAGLVQPGERTANQPDD
jgi:DNA-binding NarL/FixJ family response regulator